LEHCFQLVMCAHASQGVPLHLRHSWLKYHLQWGEWCPQEIHPCPCRQNMWVGLNWEKGLCQHKWATNLKMRSSMLIQVSSETNRSLLISDSFPISERHTRRGWTCEGGGRGWRAAARRMQPASRSWKRQG
jgi:hypothetical protein